MQNKMLEFYGLQEHPFGTTPNPRFLFPSETHRRAQTSLALGIESQFGFTALIAPPGLGKTTLLFDLLSKYRSTAQAAFVFTTQCTSSELFRYIATDLQIPGTENETDTVKLHQKFAQFVAHNVSPHPVLIVIDEAQNLDASALETIRLLSDFETPDRKLLHIILAGQPQLRERLRDPRLSQLLQRITCVTRLTPLSFEETSSYIEYRLHAAGFKGQNLFSDQAVEKITAESSGVPRAINRICLNALQLGYAAERRLIGCDLIDEASVAFDLDDDPMAQLRTPLEPLLPTTPLEIVSSAKKSDPEPKLAATARPVLVEPRKQPRAVLPVSRLAAEKISGQFSPAAPPERTSPQKPRVRPYQWSNGHQVLWIALSIIVITLAVFGYVEWQTIVATLANSDFPQHVLAPAGLPDQEKHSSPADLLISAAPVSEPPPVTTKVRPAPRPELPSSPTRKKVPLLQAHSSTGKEQHLLPKVGVRSRAQLSAASTAPTEPAQQESSQQNDDPPLSGTSGWASGWLLRTNHP
jgi:type II secretory pathway predicted ATPase ExeA